MNAIKNMTSNKKNKQVVPLGMKPMKIEVASAPAMTDASKREAAVQILDVVWAYGEEATPDDIIEGLLENFKVLTVKQYCVAKTRKGNQCKNSVGRNGVGNKCWQHAEKL